MNYHKYVKFCIILSFFSVSIMPVAYASVSIADFEGASPLSGITKDTGITLAISTSKGITSGTQSLAMNLASRSSAGTDSGTIYLNIPSVIDGSNYSRVSFDVTNTMTDDTCACAGITLYSPGADPNWGVYGLSGAVLHGTSKTISIDLKSAAHDNFGMVPAIDVSAISNIRISVARRPYTSVLLYIDNIRLELDNAAGSPTTELQSSATQLKIQYTNILNSASWTGISASKQQSLTAMANGILAQLNTIIASCSTAIQNGGFAGSYDETRATFETIKSENKMGQFFLLHKPAFYTWQISPYVNILKQEYPAADSQALAQIQVSMGKGEYRDAVFMVSSNVTGSQQVAVSLEMADTLLQNNAMIQESLYVTNTDNQIVGGANYKLEGPLTIPESESRQIRVRFNAKSGGLTPGTYNFNIRLTDTVNAYEQVIPGSVEVWNFELPDAATFMHNNTYSEFANSSMSDMNDLMVKDMKDYGLNVISVHPFDICINSGSTHTFSLSKLNEYVGMVMQNWGTGQRPKFVFSLGYGIAPSGSAFGPWVTNFNNVLVSYGLTWSDYSFVFGDEATEWGLATFELPLHENAKTTAPNAKIFSNSSSMLSDPALRSRYFAATDQFGPDLDVVHMNTYLMNYFHTNGSGKPLSLFRCRGDWATRRANMYNYYRVYGWECFSQNCQGLGLWSYCVDNNKNPWTGQESQYALVFRHPAKRDLVHSRRYETFREGIDDYRYMYLLRQVAQTRSSQEQAHAENLIQSALADVTTNINDYSKADYWRLQIAQEILATTPRCGDSTHPYPQYDFTHDCKVDFADVALFASHWLECTHPDCI